MRHGISSLRSFLEVNTCIILSRNCKFSNGTGGYTAELQTTTASIIASSLFLIAMALLAIALFTFIHRSQAILALEQSETLDPITANLMRRSLFNIIWGSLFTTLICVWVAVHPNVPQPYEGLWKRLGK